MNHKHNNSSDQWVESAKNQALKSREAEIVREYVIGSEHGEQMAGQLLSRMPQPYNYSTEPAAVHYGDIADEYVREQRPYASNNLTQPGVVNSTSAWQNDAASYPTDTQPAAEEYLDIGTIRLQVEEARNAQETV